MRHALATELRLGGESVPAAFHELVVGRTEAGRGGDRVGALVEGATDLIAYAVERRQHLRGEAAGFFEHGIDDVGAGVGIAEPGEQGVGAEHVVQGEAEIGQRGGVAAHAGSLKRVQEGVRVSAARR